MREAFWRAFTDAENLSAQTVSTIASILFERWKDNIKDLTDLIMVINHKSWQHSDFGTELCDLYAELYYEYYEKAIDYLEKKGRDEDLTYFIRTLD